MIKDNPEQTVPQAFTFKGEGNKTIHALKWLPPSSEIKALLIINHGMAEHIKRYSRFASFMVGKGFAVYGQDHRGHGKTAGTDEKLGHFGEDQGWMNVVSDIRRLYLLAAEEQSGVPVFIFGHSMGSFLTRHYLSLYGSELKGAILSGTGFHSSPLIFAAKLLASLESSIKGKGHRSKMLDKMTFSSYNKSFSSETATGFEWLSRDVKEVSKYIEDPHCGFICSSGFYSDLADGLKIINKKNCYISTPDDLPLLVYSGNDDPVGARGKGVEIVASNYKKNGSRDLTLVLKDKYRHECLNELKREETFLEIYEWIAARLAG